MSHVDEGTLHAYLDGEVTGEEREQVAAHLAACAACRTQLEEARALVARARDLLALAAPPAAVPRRVRLWPRIRLPLAWAATIAIAFAAGRYVPETQSLAPLPLPSVGTAPPVSTAPPALPKTAARTEPRREARPAARQPAQVAQAAPGFDLDSARALLGQAPVLLPDLPVRSVARADDGGGVVLEQELEAGTVVRLYERRAVGVEPAAPAVAADRMVARAPRAVAAAGEARAPTTGERLARYVGSLRIEMAGPLPQDSLSRLLELVR